MAQEPITSREFFDASYWDEMIGLLTEIRDLLKEAKTDACRGELQQCDGSCTERHSGDSIDESLVCGGSGELGSHDVGRSNSDIHRPDSGNDSENSGAASEGDEHDSD